ncbi:mannose-6-phosphate isomerase [Clostridium paraputrificum]|uniref:Putative mannose-6-phosphate isomerase GmuF n=1 Tax=Clostridium paraputrificum TaxID=29363 RepID=A0A6N3GQX5_9CLOT
MRRSNYNKYPETIVYGFENEVYTGYKDIVNAIVNNKEKNKCIVVDCYPGVDDTEVLNSIAEELSPDKIIYSEDIFYEGDKLTKLMEKNLTDDRVRGVMYYGSIMDFIDISKLEEAKKNVDNSQGLTLIYGFGASLISKGTTLVYADMARWEIQLRYRKGMPNFKQKNYDEDVLRKYKRAFFIEWRIADKHKEKLYEEIDFYLDTNTANMPKMVTGRALLAGLDKVSKQPFRLVPYFDPGVWGGQWMKEVCGLDKDEENFAWSFDGVPEENSIYIRYGDVRIESPAMNLVKYKPKELLGEKNYSRFGAEFPIRFDFLDTMDGQNLSLQVHPITEYIKNKFGMMYTQDESYYILDSKDGGGVYLGVKEDVSPNEMIKDLEIAQEGKVKFDADKYINLFPAKKHDHFLIPAGTIHCSTANCMVLEISATPYIFTFKLWDWDRVGLDGLPRPIHIEDGKQVIQWDRRTKWVEENLVNNFEVLEENENYKEVKTGLHELEFIETRVITSSKETLHNTDGGVNVLNLVEGECAIVESIDGKFEPLEIHYAETFIIPACVGDYTIKPIKESDGKCIKVLKAFVRN